jgi:hypothetical protein
MLSNIADFIRGKPCVDDNAYIVNPKLGLFVSRPHVNVSRSIAFV